jgi:formylglycine-generating enzyme required for sulfatase activity
MEANRMRITSARQRVSRLRRFSGGVEGSGFIGGNSPTQALLGDGVSMEFVYVGPGSFDMGSSPTEAGHKPAEGPLHPVNIRHGFWMARTEVTQAQWQAVMHRNPSRFVGDRGEALRPAERVSWMDARLFCEKLSQLFDARFRLPSEAEWEYACRAGSESPWWFGKDAENLPPHA